MFFTTNPPNPDELNAELIRALQQFAAGERNAADVPKLSDIDRASFSVVGPLWLQIPTEVRRFVVRQMVEQAETNVELNFSRMMSIVLRDPDAEARVLAVQGLWEDLGTSLFDQLLAMLEDEDDTAVREAIAQSLGRFSYLAVTDELDAPRSERLRFVLLDLFRSDEPIAVRKAALESVAYFSDDFEVEDAIDEAFGSIFEELRVSAIFAMGRNLAERWFETVMGEMQDTEPEIRFEAARAAGEFGDERAVSLLLDLLDDEDREVQLAAIGSLGEIGGKVAIGTLRRLVRSDDPVINDAAQDALTQATISTDPLRLL